MSICTIHSKALDTNFWSCQWKTQGSSNVEKSYRQLVY